MELTVNTDQRKQIGWSDKIKLDAVQSPLQVIREKIVRIRSVSLSGFRGYSDHKLPLNLDTL